MGRIVNDVFGPVNISAGASIYQYTVLADGTLRIQPFLDVVAGGATDYIAWVQKQRGGAGVSYPFLPLTTGTGIAGWTEIAFSSISLDCVTGDVIDVYVDGQPADVAVSGKIEIFRDHTLTEIALGVWNTLTASLTTAGSIGKLIVDNLNSAVGSVCACVTNALLAIPAVQSALQSADLTMYRGDTWTRRITGLGDLTGATDIWFGMKDDKDDTDAQSTVLISQTVGLEIINGATATVPGNASIAVVAPATGGRIDVTIEPVEMAKLEAAKKYYYDVQKSIGGVVSTPKCGTCVVNADIVRTVT